MMKTLKMIGLMAMLCFAMPAFVSCDKDDDDKDDLISVTEVTGSYTGTLQAIVTNVDCEMPGEYTITIQKEPNEDDEVQVVIPETSFKYPGSERPSTIPSFTIPDVDVKTSGNGYIISEDDYAVYVNGVKYSGKIRGTVSGKTVEINYIVTPGAMPMPISYTFKGVKK